MDRYRTRLYKNGILSRDRAIQRTKSLIAKNAINSPSCKDVLLNGEQRKLIIETGTQTYYKSVRALPDEPLNAGDLIEWSNTKWLVTSADHDSEVYIDGEAQQCNYMLKWQNENGEIIERYIVKSNASAYNNGTQGNSLTTIGYDQALIYITLDDETVKLKRGKRFFIDNDNFSPTPYELTRSDNTSNVYEGKGCVAMILTESQLIVGRDNIELGICDYYNANNPNPNEDANSRAVIEYKSLNIRSRYQNGTAFRAKFVTNAQEISMSPVWTIDFEFKDELLVTEEKNTIKIGTLNNDLIGRYVKLKLSCEDTSFVSDEIVLRIVPLF